MIDFRVNHFVSCPENKTWIKEEGLPIDRLNISIDENQDAYFITLDSDLVLVHVDQHHYRLAEEAGETQEIGSMRVALCPYPVGNDKDEITEISLSLVCNSEKSAAYVYRVIVDFVHKTTRLPREIEFKGRMNIGVNDICFTINRFKQIKSAYVQITPKFGRQQLEKLLEYCTVETVYIDGKKNDLKYYGAIRANKLLVSEGSWLTKKCLRKMKCSVLNATNTTLSVYDYFEFLLHWEYKHLKNLKSVVITKKEDAEIADYNGAVIEDDLRMTKWHIPMRLCQGTPTQCMEPETTWYMRNHSGTLAFIEFQPSMFKFVLSEQELHVGMYFHVSSFFIIRLKGNKKKGKNWWVPNEISHQFSFQADD